MDLAERGSAARRNAAPRADIYASLRAKILARAVWSQLDLERENPCLIGGDSLTGGHHLDQNFFFRSVAGYSRFAGQ